MTGYLLDRVSPPCYSHGMNGKRLPLLVLAALSLGNSSMTVKTSATIQTTLLPKITYVGAATTIIEIGNQKPIRILTDPAFDQPGLVYTFKLGTWTKKTDAPALTADKVGAIDLILLSHDEHADNFDIEGRKFAKSSSAKVLTTPSGAERLKPELGDRAIALAPWNSISMIGQDGIHLKVTSVPAKHGIWPLPTVLVGETIGFVLEWSNPSDANSEKTTLYMTGDTVFFDGMAEIGSKFKVDIMLLHLGGVQFGISGPLLYTANGAHGVKIIKAVNPKKVIPLHFGGFTHMREDLATSRKTLKEQGVDSLVETLAPGTPTLVRY